MKITQEHNSIDMISVLSNGRLLKLQENYLRRVYSLIRVFIMIICIFFQDG